MQKIRGVKVEPDSAAVGDAALNGSGQQTSSSCSKSSQCEETGIVPQYDANQPNVANKTTPKKHNKKEIMTDYTETEDSATVNPSVDVLADQQSSNQPVNSVNLGGDAGIAAVRETSDLASSSSDKQNSSDSLRVCAHCHKQESILHEFKKCKK